MKIGWVLGGVSALVVGAIFVYFRSGAESLNDIEFRYAKVEQGELVRSTTASGILVALTSIDVRSKAGGTIVKLAVDAGSVVNKGDLIAIIDPRDTQATYDQAAADVRSANARIEQARASLSLQSATSATTVRDAEVALEQAKIRWEKAKINRTRAPIASNAQIDTAIAGWETAKQDLDRFVQITARQRKRDATGTVAQTAAAFKAADLDLNRQQELHAKGYVPQSTVERASATYEAAKAAYQTATLRLDNLDRDLAAEEKSLRLAVDRAAASKDEARAQGSQVDIAERDLREARAAVIAAEVNLQRAKDARSNISIRSGELSASQSSAVRSRVALDNARVQLESTTVLAPRDGVVTLKYAEEGTVIPPGVSQFSAGSNIVQLSDVTRLFVDCSVDEADIGSVREGQKTRVVTEAFPGVAIDGVVRRVNPSATTTNSITAITVRVELLLKPKSKVRLLPGMNATCEFITLSKQNVMLLPSQAVKNDETGAYVLVKGKDPLKPERRPVTIGESGNEGVELISGLEKGEEVVVAEINLKQLRETQQRMMEAQQSGGLAGGMPRMGGSRASGSGSGSRTGASSGGGGR